MARNVNLNGQDCDGDGWFWYIDTENFSNFGNVFLALSGATQYNVKGVFGVGNYGVYSDKCLGMYVYVEKSTAFSFKGINRQGQITAAGSEQVVNEKQWTWIEFDLSEMPKEYCYASCIVTDRSGTIRTDVIMTFNR